MDQVIEFLNRTPLAGLMLVVFVGFLLGNLRWKRFSFGSAGGTLLVALALGGLGLSLRNLYGVSDPVVTIGGFGVSLFLFSVGFEAGPRFFSSFRWGPGWRFVLVSNVVNLLAVATAVGGGILLGLGGGATAGALAGALTSVPTYAAAVEALPDPAVPSVAFALTYPIGLVLLVLMVQTLPRWMGDDLVEDDDGDVPGRRPDPELTRAYVVQEPDTAGRTLGELRVARETGCVVSRLHRGDETLVPGPATVLEHGDHVLVTGRLDELERFEKLVGPEVYDEDMRRRLPNPRKVLVTRRAAVGKTLAELDLIRRHRCLVVHIRRGDLAVEPAAEVVLERGDLLEVAGPRSGLHTVAEELGRFEMSSPQLAAVVYAGGLMLGRLLGRIEIPLGDLEIRLGPTGLVLAGLLLGRLGQAPRFRLDVPLAARHLVRDLGILLFIAETGLLAGGSSLASMEGRILATIGLGVAVTVIPVVGAIFIARRLLRLRAADAWGAVCGGMTSSAALAAVREASDGQEPTVSYSAAFAVATVVVTLVGQAVAVLLP